MKADQQFSVHDGIAEYRPQGEVTLEKAIELIKAAIESARAQGIRKLLVILTGLKGFAPPGDGARHQLSRKWATAGRGAMHLAFVARPDLIDPEKFGVIVARNFGASVDIFMSEADAMLWLGRKSDP